MFCLVVYVNTSGVNYQMKMCFIVIPLAFLMSILFLLYGSLAFGVIGIFCLIGLGLGNQSLCLILVGVLLVIQPLLGFLKLPFLGYFDEFLLLIALVVFLFRKFLDRKPLIRTPIDMCFGGLLVIGMISSIIHQIVPWSVTLGGALLFCKGFLFFYIFSNVTMRQKDIDSMMRIFVALGLAVAGYGILGAFFPGIFLPPLGIPSRQSYFIPSLQSFLGHPGAFAAFMAILASFTFARYWITGQKKALFLNIFFVICMILSFRRTSVMGYFLATLIVIFWKGLPKSSAAIHRNMMIAIIIVMGVAFSGSLGKMYTNLYQGYFTRGETPRSMLMKTGVQIAKDYFPLGTGFGTYASGINRSFYSPLFYKYRLFTVWGLSEDKDDFINDTFWPHVVAEVGVFGFLLYLAILFSLIRIPIQALKTPGDIEWKTFVLGVLMMFIISIVESTKATFYEGTVWAYFYFGGIGLLFSKFQERKVYR